VKLLKAYLHQYRTKHGKDPSRIVITPAAALAVCIKSGIAPSLDGIPVEGKDFDEPDVAKDGSGTRLGLFIRNNHVVACDLI